MPGDAAAVDSLGWEFAEYLRSLGDPDPHSLTAEEYLRDGFGEQPAFAGLIANLDGRAVGYLLYHPGYDLDREVVCCTCLICSYHDGQDG